MKAKRSLGQHFLVSSRAIDGILEAARRGAARGAAGVVEIGPGPGALTEGLAALGLPLVLVEKDDAFAPELAKRFPEAQVLHRDARDMDWEALPGPKGPPWVVVGNLPYNVGTDIARAVLATPSRWASVIFMLQVEVVQKFAGRPGEEGYGALAAWTRAAWVPDLLFEVPPGAFRPPPKVTSAVVAFAPRTPQDVVEEALPAYERFLRTAFTRPRRTLAANLSETLPREVVIAALVGAGLPPDARPGATPPRVLAWLFGALRTTDHRP